MCIKLKLAWLVVGDVELTKRQYLHPSAAAFTHGTIIPTPTTTTATEAKNTTINYTATTITAATTTAATEAKGLKPKTLGNIETIFN